jgi:hypothetical protein
VQVMFKGFEQCVQTVVPTNTGITGRTTLCIWLISCQHGCGFDA